jgi:integrase
MANRAVSIWYGVRINSQFKRLKPAYGKNHKIRPGWAVLKNKVRELPGGSYYVGWYEGSRRIWREAGTVPHDAVNLAERQRLYLEAARVGVPIQREDGASPALSAAISLYLEQYGLSRKEESYELVAHTLNQFQQHCRRTFLNEVTKLDLLKFADWLQRVEKNKPRTASNKFMRVNQFLRVNKIALVSLKDAPRYVEQKPEVYTDDELDKFFAVCDPYQRAVFKTFLQAGLRMQELMFLKWSDIDFAGRTIAVTAKPDYDFTPKAYHERLVHVPSELVEILQARRKIVKPPTLDALVFPTKSDRPNDKLLQACKRIARRAGVNCGLCDTCKKADECRRWFLQKFRASFATRLLQGKMDIESVREQMGHKDTDSISRYLAPLRGKAMGKKVDEAWAKKLDDVWAKRFPGGVVKASPDGQIAVQGVAVHVFGGDKS